MSEQPADTRGILGRIASSAEYSIAAALLAVCVVVGGVLWWLGAQDAATAEDPASARPASTATPAVDERAAMDEWQRKLGAQLSALDEQQRKQAAEEEARKARQRAADESAAEARRQGLTPILAGRNPAAVHALVPELRRVALEAIDIANRQQQTVSRHDCGGLDRVFAMTTQWAFDRYTFGRPIASQTI